MPIEPQPVRGSRTPVWRRVSALSLGPLLVGAMACTSSGSGRQLPPHSAAPSEGDCPASNGKLAPYDFEAGNGPYRVEGNRVLDQSGARHLFRGLDRPSLEWSRAGENLTATDFVNMASWGSNVVRIALNQVYWLQNGEGYQRTVAATVGWAHDAGMDVILDLHWSDAGGTDPAGEQHDLADANSLVFWDEVASVYKDDPNVLFELYNEPRLGGGNPSTSDWQSWRDGGPSPEGFEGVGMQQLYEAVRGTGAENLVIVGGLHWAYDLSRASEFSIDGYNVMYASHPYDNSNLKQPDQWDRFFGYLAADYPVILTEFGTFDCGTEWIAELLDYSDDLGLHWTAWAWYATGDVCAFPSLITGWNGFPSETGALVQASLCSDKSALPGVGGEDASAGGSDVDAGSPDAG